MFETGDQGDDPTLTSRECEILELVAYGMSAKQIAQKVEIAPRTVERHIENCRHKLRARNKAHLVAKAVALGQLRVNEPDPETVEARPLFRFRSRVRQAKR